MNTPQLPTPEELAGQRDQMMQVLLVASEQMAPLFDAADGVRADMEKRGWSPTAAEQVGLTWLMTAMSGINSSIG